MKYSLRLVFWLFAPLAPLVLFIGCQAGSATRASSVDAAAQTTVAGATSISLAPAPQIEEPFPLPIVELRGKAADIGDEHGRRLGPSIRLLHDSYLTRFIHGGVERFIALAAAQAFSAKLEPEHRDEVAAMAKASELDGREAMLGQCFLDLMPMVACSTVALSADASPDGVARLGRDLDFPSLDVADKYTTVFVYHPENRYAFASIGWPGLIGVLSGMNEHGLTIANMEVTRGPRLPTAMPYIMLYRTILEQCRTTQEALDLLERSSRQTANNLIIMDASGDRAVAEIAPDRVTVRRPDSVCLISTNHRRDQDNATLGRCKRYDALRQKAEADFGRIDVPVLESMLAASSQKNETLQSMVFEPANRVVYLSAGLDAAHHPFHRLDLKPYFGN